MLGLFSDQKGIQAPAFAVDGAESYCQLPAESKSNLISTYQLPVNAYLD